MRHFFIIKAYFKYLQIKGMLTNRMYKVFPKKLEEKNIPDLFSEDKEGKLILF